MQWQGKIDLGKPITLNGKPHGVEYVLNKPEHTAERIGQVIFVESENKVYIGTSQEFIELTPNSQSHNHNDIYYLKSEVNSMMSSTDGHDHDGLDSKKISFTNLVDVPTRFSPEVHGNERHDANYIVASQVNYTLLTTNNLVGDSVGQISAGTHNHDSVYTKKVDLAAISGASLVGVDSISTATNAQQALVYLNDNFNNYYTKAQSFSQTEVTNNFVSLDDNQTIFGEKTFDNKVGIRNVSTIVAPLHVEADSSKRHIFVGSAVDSTQKNDSLVDANTSFTGDLSNRNIYGLSSDIKIEIDENLSPVSVYSNNNRIRLNNAYPLSSDITANFSEINKTGVGSLNSVSVSTTKFSTNINTLTTTEVKLLDLQNELAINSSIENLYGLYVESSNNPSSINNNFGVYIENISGVDSSYSIYTNQGLVRFGDKLIVDKIEPETVSGDIGSITPFNSISANEFKLNSSKSITIDNGEISLKDNSSYSKIMTASETYSKTEINNLFIAKSWREPVQTASERDDLVNKTVGDVVYVIGEEQFYVYNGSQWVYLIKTSSENISYTNSNQIYDGNVQSALNALVSTVTDLNNRIIQLESSGGSGGGFETVITGGSSDSSLFTGDPIVGGDAFTETFDSIIDGGKA